MKFLLPLAFLISLFLYHPVLDCYFFQDDFFEMNYAKAENLQEYFNFFNFRSDIVDYRPISQLNYFFFLQKIFGLNPVGYRLTSFILFFTTALIIAKLIAKISKSVETGVLTASLWLTSSVHFMNLTWISASYNITGTFFFTLASLIFIVHLKTKNRLYYFVTLLIFVLTLGSFEFALTWPLIFGLYFAFVLNNSVKTTIYKFTPFILISLIYLVARFLFMDVPKIPEYQTAANIESIKAFFWYVLWSFNIPEEFKKQVVNNLIGLNPIFLAEFWKITAIEFIAFLWIVVLAVATVLFKKRQFVNTRLCVFSLVFFTLAISPVLVLPNHTFTMYLTLSSIGIYWLVSYLLTLLKSKTVVLVVLIIWLASSFVTISFYRINSWMIEAQKVGQTFASQMKDRFPYLPANSTVLYYLPYPWQWQALSYGEAIKTIYNDQTLGIYYNEESLRKDFSAGKLKGPIYIYEE